MKGKSVASDPITAKAQKQLLVDIFLNTFHRERGICSEKKWLTIIVEHFIALDNVECSW
jgi:hypothetical protein